MTCYKCKTEFVIQLPNSNIKLCKRCFNRYFERKVRKCIRVNKLIRPKEKIGIALSGGKDSVSLLVLLRNIFPKRELVAITIDEGNPSIKDFKKIKQLCKDKNIKLYVYSFKEEFGKELKDIIPRFEKVLPCSTCAVLRRYLLNKKARELRLDKLATGHNLDDESQSILMNQFRKNIRASAILGPITGVVDENKFVRRIKPLYFLTDNEVRVFASINRLINNFERCVYASKSYRNSVKEFLDKFEEEYPGTKHNIVSSFLDILPMLKEKYRKNRINYCKNCGEACSQEECQTCKILKCITIK